MGESGPAFADASLQERRAEVGGAAPRVGTPNRSAVRSGPLPNYAYVGGLERNRMLPTALGALRPSALVSTTFSQGDVGRLPGQVAIVGTPALRDFHAGLCAANLRASGIDALAVELELELDRADANPLGIARRFDDAGWRAQVAAQLAQRLQGVDRVGLPAVVGVTDPHGAWNDLIDRIERPAFEIPTLPPSVPGMRVFEILYHALRSAGGRLVLGAGVVSHRREGERVTAVDTATAGSSTAYEAEAFVLASGGFHSGAIALDSHWQAREQVLGLPLAGVPAADERRFAPGYFEEQPLARCGVAVDSELRPHGVANVVVAGASLPGSVSWREASGEGIALASGYRAAQLLAAQLGAEVMA